MTLLRLIYLALLIVGTFLPWSYFYAWFAENGWSLSAMIDAWYVNDATSGLVYDLTIAALALTVWALWEGLARRDRWFLLPSSPRPMRSGSARACRSRCFCSRRKAAA
jgi:hypothetical protein